jgi:hypothetical protein
MSNIKQEPALAPADCLLHAMLFCVDENLREEKMNSMQLFCAGVGSVIRTESGQNSRILQAPVLGPSIKFFSRPFWGEGLDMAWEKSKIYASMRKSSVVY